jgi:hypothetical protein
VAILCHRFGGYALYTLDATGFEEEEVEDPPIDVAQLAGRPSVDNHLNVADEDGFVKGLTARQKKQLKWERNPVHALCPTTWDDTKDLSLSMTQERRPCSKCRCSPRCQHHMIYSCPACACPCLAGSAKLPGRG